MHEPLHTHSVTTKTHMSYIAKPKDKQVIADYLYLGGSIQDSNTHKGHQEVQVTQLPGQHDARLMDIKGLLLRYLLADEPWRVQHGPGEACNPAWP